MGIDTVCARFSSPILLEDLCSNASTQCMDLTRTQLKESSRSSGRHAYLMRMHNRECYLLARGRAWVDGFVIHLSKFSSFEEATLLLQSSIGVNHLDDARLGYLDVYIDIPVPFENAMLAFDIRYKRSQLEFMHARPTGFYFGHPNTPNQVRLYDKAAHEDEEEPRSRIEIRFKGPKRLCDTWRELPSVRDKSRSGVLSPFKHITWHPRELVNEHELGSRNALKFGELRTAIDLNGYAITRRYLGKGRNFARDYSPLLRSCGPPIDLQSVSVSSLDRFFSGS